MKTQFWGIILLFFSLNIFYPNSLHCSYQYRQALYQMHDFYEKEALIALQNNDQEMAQRFYNRMQALVKTIANPLRRVSFSIPLRTFNSIMYQLGKIYGAELYDNFLEVDEGTPLDQELHTELLQLLGCKS